MLNSGFTGHIDVALICLYLFWAFLFALIYYLRREDKREGYPLEPDHWNRSTRVTHQGYPKLPKPKTFVLPHGGVQSAPRPEKDTRDVKAEPVGPWPGAPLRPMGDPMRDGVGPASWAERAEVPDMTMEGDPVIVPLRNAADFRIDSRDPDPRGMEVFAADKKVAGQVVDVWIDRAYSLIRYLEVEVPAGKGSRRVLLPMTLAEIAGGSYRPLRVKAKSVLARQFAGAPALADPDLITLREEDRISAYFASGYLYATPERQGPLL